MNTLEAIAQRRSIRHFKDASLPDEVLRQILHAGSLAPSGNLAGRGGVIAPPRAG